MIKRENKGNLLSTQLARVWAHPIIRNCLSNALLGFLDGLCHPRELTLKAQNRKMIIYVINLRNRRVSSFFQQK